MRSLTFDERVVANSLLAKPAMRGLSPDELARALRVPAQSARAGIASVVDLAAREGKGELLYNDSLSYAIGGLSLDRAMSRYGSNAAPPTYSARPVYTRRANAGADDATDNGGGAVQNNTPVIAQGDNRGGVVDPIKQAPAPVQVGPSPAPAPDPVPPPSPSVLASVPWYVWAGAAVAGGLLVFGKKKRGKK